MIEGMVRKLSVIIVLALATQVWAAVSEEGRSAVEAARSYGAAVRSFDMGWALDYMYPPLKKTLAERFSSREGNERENALIVMGLREEKTEQTRARNQANLKALRDHYVKMGKAMAGSGMKIESFAVREPVAEYVVTATVTRGAEPTSWGDASAPGRGAAGGGSTARQGERQRSRLVVLPTTVVVSIPSPHGGVSRIEKRSHIYAIRDEVVSGPVDRNGLTTRDTKLNKWYFADANTDVTLLRSFFPNLPLHLDLPTSGERELN